MDNLADCLNYLIKYTYQPDNLHPDLMLKILNDQQVIAKYLLNNINWVNVNLALLNLISLYDNFKNYLRI